MENIINHKTKTKIMIKIQIKSVLGNLLFEYEKENNTIKKTVEEANLKGADLTGADLTRVNLKGADLKGADLTGADLTRVNLKGADLKGANLTAADLKGANLTAADLREADLTGANLREANLTGANLKGALIPIYCKWDITVCDDKIKIGCKTKTIEEWDVFFESKEKYETTRNTTEFKQIQAAYNASKAYLTTLNQ